MIDVLDVHDIKKYLREFATERNWEKYHSPKNLAMALSVEASELLEIFQWMTEKESFNIKDPKVKEHVGEEMADVILYMIRMADLLDINLSEAISDKQKKNEARF